MAWDTGTVVLWRSVKEGVVRTVKPMRVVRDDEDLIALYICPGTPCMRRKGRRGGPSPYCDGWERWVPDPIWTVPELPPNWQVVE